MMQEWVNTEKRRYYRAFTEVDLLGDMVLVQDYGSMDTERGGRLTRVVRDLAEARRMLSAIGKVRARHGYKEASHHLQTKPA